MKRPPFVPADWETRTITRQAYMERSVIAGVLWLAMVVVTYVLPDRGLATNILAPGLVALAMSVLCTAMRYSDRAGRGERVVFNAGIYVCGFIALVAFAGAAAAFAGWGGIHL